jgi:hypothetical protein
VTDEGPARLKTTHVTFNLSAAVDIGLALKSLGRDDVVIAFPDNLSYGPIDATDGPARKAWLKNRLEMENSEIADAIKSFWAEIAASTTSQVAWFSRRCPPEYCGFLEYLKRIGGRPALIIETTEIKQSNGAPVPGTGLIPASQMVSDGLLDSAKNLSAEFRARSNTLWQSLRDENAPLRIVDQDLALVSVPISFYDDLLLSFAADWISTGLVVGKSLADVWDRGAANVGDGFLFSRLRALLEAGVLETRPGTGKFPDIKLARP